MKYYGRDINIVEAFDQFKKLHTDQKDDLKRKGIVFVDSMILTWFLIALSDLKYMGIVSATKQSTFLFKKNIFGKPKLYKSSI